MDKVKLGQVVNVIGIKGELKIYNYSDSLESYRNAEYIFIGDKTYAPESVRQVKNTIGLKVKEINDRNQAELLKGLDVSIPAEMLPELPEGEYYIRDLIGLFCVDENGVQIGVLQDVVQNTSQDLYTIKLEDGKRIQIPGVEEFLREVDLAGGKIVFRLPDGIMELKY